MNKKQITDTGCKALAILSLYLLCLADEAVCMPWSRDMYSQPSHKAQEDIPPPVPDDSIPTKGRERIRDREAAAMLPNPVPPVPGSIERGRLLYGIHCSVCHGEKGAGDGPVSRKFIPPADLSGEYVRSKPDGDIYYTITNGGIAVMPGYGDGINEEDRWHIINYIRKAF